MILIGRNLSPFVRRTAAALNLLGLRYTQRPFSTVDNATEIRSFNPLGRVPALVMEDGEVLVDSAAILDALDDLAGPDRALVPRGGAARRAVLRANALATGATEKVVAAYYESRRPEALRWADNLAKQIGQAQAGFAALDQLAESGGWLCGEAPTLADLTAVARLDFADVVLPDLAAERFPALSALRDRANALEAIGSTRWQA
ncbi:glutathione S-transferase family protein [Falsiroseomonas tokyonensis]|uniref:Glutathione S-transferase family protein n=1 Tax=Falsiroseomonas tokyonensis TaxID=430521 RepID=A0ABV7C3A9_9PROT|nr:glutathione S-transferase family protein [Falsiroseomonas tokyonensis]MBU8541574.1 glutathione S-transferase family protein [Falsiroseomonas tokyonensis]